MIIKHLVMGEVIRQNISFLYVISLQIALGLQLQEFYSQVLFLLLRRW
jgi:hypothetical protein